MKPVLTLATTARIAAAAFALTLLVANPAGQPALAAGDTGQPPVPITPVPHPPTGPLRHAAPDPMVYKKGSSPLGTDGHVTGWFAVKNIGLTISKPILVYTYCHYRDQNFKFIEVAASPVKVLQPMTPKAIPTNVTVDCGTYDGLTPINLRVLIVSDGDGNLDNNLAIASRLV